MDETVDVACDICGQKYQLSPSRLGLSTQCRECGTKFQVREYAPPPDPDQVEAGNPWPWIRGAGVTALVLALVSGLASLPFYRPQPRVNQVQASSPTVSSSRPTQTTAPRGAVQTRQSPRQNPRPNSLPGRATGQSGFAAQGVAIEPTAESGTARPPGPASTTTAALTITNWTVVPNSQRRSLRLTGSGFGKTSAVQTLRLGNLIDETFQIVSDQELEVSCSVPQSENPVVLVTTADGVAVAYAKTAQVVSAGKSEFGYRQQDAVYLVQSGGQLEFHQPAVVLVEKGGQVAPRALTYCAFLKSGAVLQPQPQRVQMVVAEEGSKLPPSLGTTGYRLIMTRQLTYCSLPPLAGR
ncbi:MAG: hypothetical protein JSS02_14555 [Planctomycetes bacterium]|nr:hypothetical protein [Planctomycetota bacterium]